MSRIRSKYYRYIGLRIRFPRKIKKSILGLKLSKKDLKQKINEFKSLQESITFCPDCGCENEYIVRHAVEYPEVYNEYFCYRCDKITAFEDNSPYRHILQFKKGEF